MFVSPVKKSRMTKTVQLFPARLEVFLSITPITSNAIYSASILVMLWLELGLYLYLGLKLELKFVIINLHRVHLRPFHGARTCTSSLYNRS